MSPTKGVSPAGMMKELTEEQEQCYTYTEDVTLGAGAKIGRMRISSDNLGSNVPRSPASFVEVFFSVSLRGQAEVAELDDLRIDNWLGLQHDVLRLYISMNDIQLG